MESAGISVLNIIYVNLANVMIIQVPRRMGRIVTGESPTLVNTQQIADSAGLIAVRLLRVCIHHAVKENAVLGNHTLGNA